MTGGLKAVQFIRAFLLVTESAGRLSPLARVFAPINQAAVRPFLHVWQISEFGLPLRVAGNALKYLLDVDLIFGFVGSLDKDDLSRNAPVIFQIMAFRCRDV